MSYIFTPPITKQMYFKKQFVWKPYFSLLHYIRVVGKSGACLEQNLSPIRIKIIFFYCISCPKDCLFLSSVFDNASEKNNNKEEKSQKKTICVWRSKVNYIILFKISDPPHLPPTHTHTHKMHTPKTPVIRNLISTIPWNPVS